MKTAKIFLAVFFSVAAVPYVGMGYLGPYVLDHKTFSSNDELVVRRGDGFYSVIEYAKNRRSGDEHVVARSHAPFLGRYYLNIEYSAKCDCINSLYEMRGDEIRSVFRSGDVITLATGNKILYRRGVSEEEVREDLTAARSKLDDARNRFRELAK